MQARLSSSRLPAKALLPINGMPTLMHAMLGVQGVADRDVLACDRESESVFRPLATQAHYALVSGELDDVLSRFAKVMEQYPSQYIIRATADNLIVGKKLVSSALEQAIATGADYFCYEQTPYGSGVEVMRSEALLMANEQSSQRAEREHVSPYLYQHPEVFRIVKPLAPKWALASELRSTMDTMDDYQRLIEFFAEVSTSEDNIVEEYIAWMKQRI